MKPQHILITGATSGIGRHAALHLHERGHLVIATGRRAEALEELRAQGLTTLRLDVTDSDSIAQAVAQVHTFTDGKGLDALVNNAGYGLLGPLEILTDEDVRAQFDTNVFGVLALIRAFLPQMRSKGSGRIVNVSSVGGRVTFPLGGAYHATKYALEAMSDALRMEVRQFGVRVSLIEPGYIKTGFASTSLSLIDRYGRSGPYSESLKLADLSQSAIERFAAPPGAVSRAVERSITDRWPKARYVAPRINTLAILGMRLLPTGLLDRVLIRLAGLRRPSRLVEENA